MISVILPTYNEAQNIERIIPATAKDCEQGGRASRQRGHLAFRFYQRIYGCVKEGPERRNTRSSGLENCA
jgi:hypothetical protein